MAFLSLGIAGGTGSGKSTLARALAARIRDPHLVLDQDSYYRDLGALTLNERRQVNFDHPNSLDLSLLAEHIACLRAGRPFAKPRYDFATHTRLPGTDRIEAVPVVIVEGILLFTLAAMREQLDFKVFVDTPESLRFARRRQRDVRERGRDPESVRRQLEQAARPMHARFVQPQSEHADLRVSGEEDWDTRWETDLRPLIAALRDRGVATT